MPKGAFIGIDEVAAAVEFLLTDTARNITGQCITIDGGWTAQ
jgi:3-hydroxybutyrate dehydrogenase